VRKLPYHHVGSTARTTQAPPFSAIASKPNFNETVLAFVLLAPHPRMPEMNLSRKEADDLAAYIKTQK
jgi:hypothetical protein